MITTLLRKPTAVGWAVAYSSLVYEQRRRDNADAAGADGREQGRQPDIAANL